MESRTRRRFLFEHGFWDGLLRQMPEKEKTDWRRQVFFSGSYFFAGRPLPGVESLPLELPIDPATSEGDRITLVKCEHYTAPLELSTPIQSITSDQVSFDIRCADCTKAFVDVGSLLQHW